MKQSSIFTLSDVYRFVFIAALCWKKEKCTFIEMCTATACWAGLVFDHFGKEDITGTHGVWYHWKKLVKLKIMSTKNIKCSWFWSILYCFYKWPVWTCFYCLFVFNSICVFVSASDIDVALSMHITGNVCPALLFTCIGWFWHYFNLCSIFSWMLFNIVWSTVL